MNEIKYQVWTKGDSSWYLNEFDTLNEAVLYSQKKSGASKLKITKTVNYEINEIEEELIKGQ